MSEHAKKPVSPCAPPTAAPSGLGSWIDCLVEMPDSDLAVLIYHPDENEPIWVGYHDGKRWRTDFGAICMVSHWMNLPEPPILNPTKCS